MLIIGIIFSAGFLGCIIYFAVSPKSSRLLRFISLIALGVIALAIVICGIFLVIGPKEATDVIPLPVFEDASPKPVKNNNLIFVVIFLAILLVVLGGIVYISLKRQKKAASEPVKRQITPVFEENNDMEQSILDDDESFDIESD
jgi:flagellar basal body-associated protein FliL